MLNATLHRLGADYPLRPASRGYTITYREDQVNFCPSCGRSQWLIGRLLAECAYCGTAIPLADTQIQAMAGPQGTHPHRLGGA